MDFAINILQQIKTVFIKNKDMDKSLKLW